MNIIVCIKQVPDTKEISIDSRTGTLIREGVPSIINPDDKNAIEAALSIRDTVDKNAHICVISMGPNQAEIVLLEALAMGCDEAYLICDRVFAGSDTYATSTILSKAISHIGSFDLILCGKQAIDGDTAQVGPQLAEKLDLPQLTSVRSIEIESQRTTVHSVNENGYREITSDIPVLITCVKELNVPRYTRVSGIYKAFNQGIKILSNAELQLSMKEIGLEGSPTSVLKTFTPDKHHNSEMLEGTNLEKVTQLISNLYENHII